jgi:predicted enzyme related to lactoylglutathione lyase
LEQPIIESCQNFAMLPMAPGVMLGLWAHTDVAPAITAPGFGGELAIAVADHDAVQAAYRAWTKRGLWIIQEPTEMDFGFTFTATDLDGHRVRVMALNPMPN